MTEHISHGAKEDDLTQVLGYLNFSSGKPDAKFLLAMNRLYDRALRGAPGQYSPYTGLPPWLTLQQWLQDRLAALRNENPIYQECEQATHVLQLVWLSLLPDYLDFHNDLLFHQEPEGLFNGLFLGRAMEAVLQQGPPWTDLDRILNGAIRHLNDYVGFRPVAVLEGRRLEPYPNEWLRPIPLYIRDVGVAYGPYYDLVSRALEILRDTSPSILRDAQYDPDHLDELALDPRAYDFDHPVNKRPNYYFGQWDPNLIDSKGDYRRFVLQQVTVDALLSRIENHADLPRDQVVTEAAAVLAGTMLMASGISGGCANAFSSNTTLPQLLSHIAAYRDGFYAEFLETVTGPHRERLQSESAIRRQPLGGARQELNTTLARLRAAQVERVQLARIFARMGSATAAKDESDDVQVPSARILCRIDCLLTIGNQLLRRGDLEKAAEVPDQIFDLIQRGIQCGALVDPWNILGFAGNFPRFIGADATVLDDRVRELVHIMEQTFSLLSRLWREAAASDDEDLCRSTEACFRRISNWWRKFAAHEVSDVQATDPQVAFESSELVARALRLWHQGGAAAGDLKFWTPHAAIFSSPKAYGLVIEALLDRRDFVSCMPLLVQWLSQASEVGLQSGNTSYSDLARMWLEKLFEHSSHNHITTQEVSQGTRCKDPDELVRVWSLVEKFFDYLEANGDAFWQVPMFQLSPTPKRRKRKPPQGSEPLEDGFPEEDEGGLAERDETVSSAYIGLTYKSDTDDGFDGSVFEQDEGTNEELISESKRISEHMTFLTALAQMWKLVAESTLTLEYAPECTAMQQQKTKILSAIDRWSEQCLRNREGLVELLDQVQGLSISRGGTDTDSMTQYDRKRVTKESLIERILATAVETTDAGRMLLGSMLAHCETIESFRPRLEALPLDEKLAVELYGDLMAARRASVDPTFAAFLDAVRDQPLLYVSLARGGNPREILMARTRRRTLTHLLTWLPRQGFYLHACRLVDTARNMEHQHPVGLGAVTEFDDLFQNAFKSLVRGLIRNAYQWQAQSPSTTKRRPTRPRVTQSNLETPIDPASWRTLELDDIVDQNPPEPDSDVLVPLLEQLTEILLSSWLSHSRTLRLSVLETVEGTATWSKLANFIQQYGMGIFTQGFLRLSNVRAILHQGVGVWLKQAIADEDSGEIRPLLDAIEAGEITIEESQRWLAVVFEAIIDHFTEYKDYNSTTTQSDRGEMLYMLLDFLRLRVRYDRVCWNLKPVFWAHEVLVHSGCQQSAQQWRRALSDRVSRESDQYLERLRKLQEAYAMKMPTVADRLNERFLKPMTIDRMRALIRPAMRQLRSNDREESRAFDLLVQEAHLMMREPTGVGLEIPAWLIMLEDEVDRVLHHHMQLPQSLRLEKAVPSVLVSLAEIQDQLKQAQFPNRSLGGPEATKD